MITFRHKGLKAFYEKEDASKLPKEQLRKIARILLMLEALESEEDIRNIGFGTHKLKGKLSERWAIKVSANYRITFQFSKPNVLDVDYEDYH